MLVVIVKRDNPMYVKVVLMKLEIVMILHVIVKKGTMIMEVKNARLFLLIVEDLLKFILMEQNYTRMWHTFLHSSPSAGIIRHLVMPM